MAQLPEKYSLSGTVEPAASAEDQQVRRCAELLLQQDDGLRFLCALQGKQTREPWRQCVGRHGKLQNRCLVGSTQGCHFILEIWARGPPAMVSGVKFNVVKFQ